MRGIALGKRVAMSTDVRMYWWPVVDFVKGPTMSIASLCQGVWTSGMGRSGWVSGL